MAARKTAKIHLRINVIGLPKAIALTGGEVSDFEAYMPVMNPDVRAEAPLTDGSRC